MGLRAHDAFTQVLGVRTPIPKLFTYMASVLTVDSSPQTSFSSSYTSNEYVNYFLVIIAPIFLNLDVQ